jgi:molecular chaperone GrpE
MSLNVKGRTIMSEDRSKEASRFQVSDRRFWVEDPSLEESAETSEEKYPSFVEELKSRTEAAEKKLRKRLSEIDEENTAFRDRLNKQLDKRVTEGQAEFLRDLLEVVDNFERAISSSVKETNYEALLKGVQLTVGLFQSKLKAIGVEPIDNLNQPFDPNEAEAVSMIPVKDAARDGCVVEVVRKGYCFGDQILRPASVVVGKLE